MNPYRAYQQAVHASTAGMPNTASYLETNVIPSPCPHCSAVGIMFVVRSIAGLELWRGCTYCAAARIQQPVCMHQALLHEVKLALTQPRSPEEIDALCQRIEEAL